MTTFKSNFSRRQLLLAGAMAPVAGLLASCGDDSGSGGGKASALSMNDWWGGQFAQYFPAMQQLTGIKIKEELYSYAPEKIFTELASGTAPDMYLVDAYWNGNLFPHKKLYVPFDDRLKARGIDMSKWNVDPRKEVGYDGKVAGLSLYTAQDNIVMVNTELADKAGLLDDAPLWGKPTFDAWKWDQFVDWLKQATRRRADGTVELYGLGNVPSASQLYPTLLYDLGGTLFDDDWNYNESKSMLDQDPAIEAGQLYADLFSKHQVAAQPEAEAAIRGGTYLAKRCVATIQLSTPSSYPESQNFPMSYFHLPYTQNKVHTLGGGHLCVNGASKYQDAAHDWVITFCTNADIRSKFLQYSSVPSYDPLPIVEAAPEGSPKTIALINLSRIKGMSSVPENTNGVVVFPRWFGRYASTATQNAIQTALDQVRLGKATAKEAFTEAKKQVDAAIAQGRSAAGG